MPANERRLWWCKHGHILGEVKTIVVGKSRVRALMLYEHSVTLEQLPAALPALRGRVRSMDAIRCTICGSEKDWIAGNDLMEALLEKRGVEAETP